MAISFEDSKKQLTQQNASTMSMRTMSISNDTPVVAAEEKFVFDKSGSYYKYYPNHYVDDKVSYVDNSKNIVMNDKQHNVTQETNSQCIPFELDRYYDGVDLSKMKFSIHYVNSKNKEGVAIPVNFAYSESKIRFGWLLDNNVTYVDGDVSFEIVAGGVNEKRENYIWRTRPNGKINILKSLTGDSTIRPTQNWYTTFISEMNAILDETKSYAEQAANSAQEAEETAEAIHRDIQSEVGNQLNSAIEEKFNEKLPNYYTKDEIYNKTEVYNKEEVYNKTEVYNREESDSVADTKIDTALEDYYTKSELDELFIETEQAIGTVDAKFADYDLSTEVDTKITTALDDYYTIDEVNTKFEEFDISDQLEGINSEIDTINDKFNDYDTSIQVDEKISDALEDYYTKTEIDSKFEEFDISDQLNGVNADIEAIESEVNTAKGDIVTLKNDVAQAKSDISTLNTGMTGVNTVIEQIQRDIEGFESNVYEAFYGTTEEGVENTFILYENGEVKNQFVIQGGGGGGAAATNLVVERITNSPLAITPTDKAIIEFNCTSTDSDGQTVDCSYVWKKGNTVISSGTLVQGKNSFDLTEYASVGSQKFTLTVSDDGGSVNVKTWTVQVVDVRLVSSFNDQILYEANKSVSFTYTPYGAISKTVHFKLDGNELDSVTTTASGLLQSYTLPAQPHGAHLLEVYITANVNGIDIATDHIYKDIIWYDETSEVPVIGCIYRYDHFGAVPARQYNATDIIYTVYDPKVMNPTVTRYVDEKSIGTQKLETNTNVWSYKTADVGEKVLKIECGITSVEIKLDVAELGITIEPVTANLAFDFNPAGRSNSDADRVWSDANTGVTMSVSDNFDWINGGYQHDDNGDQYFCIKAGTTATINYNLFADDPKKNGKEFKIIFRTKNIKKRDTSFLTCLDQGIGLDMRVENATVYDNGGLLKSNYCEDRVIEYEFNINKDVDMPIVMSYEDGTPSTPYEYKATSSFTQLSAQPITIGSEDCDVFIYRMKAYSSSLADIDIMNNFIADARNADEMIARYNRNQIYDENNKLISTSANGGFSVDALMKVAPDLRYVFLEVPQFTNDKDNKIDGCTVYFRYPAGTRPQDNWTCTGMRHRGQGTSSNLYGYAGRNIDLCMDRSSSLFTWVDEEGRTVESSTVTLTDTSVPVDYLNIKVNIASSENANNAQLARRFNEYQPFLRYARKKDSKVKDTMEFYNCVVFVRETSTDLSNTPHREFNDTDWHFYAIGNIGDSKKTDDTRVNNANDPKEHIIEITDADKPLSAFPTGKENNVVCPIGEWHEGNTAYDILHSTEYVYDEEGAFESFGGTTYEFRYEMEDITDEQREVNINTWRDLYKFIVTSTDEEFYANLKNYFVVDSALYFYLFTERYTMVDNRAKNSFWHYGKVYISNAEAVELGETEASYYIIDDEAAAINDGYRYDLTFAYDMDTALGIDNTGDYVFSYGKEDTDYYVDGDPTSDYVFRVANSVFFCRLRDLFPLEMQAMFKSREEKNAWNSASLIDQWDNAQAQFPEELWRLDYERKYYRTYLGLSIDNSIASGVDKTFLIGKFFGRKKYARRAFESNQEIYCATKYFGNKALEDVFWVRGNVPIGSNIKPNYSLTLVPYSDMYVCVQYTSTGTPIHQKVKAGQTCYFNSDADRMDFIYVYAASYIQEVGDLSRCYIGDNNFSSATRLQKLTIGSTDDGYENTFMKTILVENNPLLEYLDLRNVSGINTVIDVSGCSNLKELYAQGTNASGAIFANGGKIEKVYLPDITSLTMKNLNYLEVFDVAGYDNLQTLVVENSPFVNTYEIINAAPKLNTIRLIGIDWDEGYNIQDTAILDRMYVMRGIDSAGYTVADSVVAGNFHAVIVRDQKKAEYIALWPELNITENTLVNQFVVTFVNDDGTVLDIQYVDKGTKPVDPITRENNPISIPTKASTVSTDYTYSGWDKEFIDAFENYTVTATYSETTRVYTVKYVSKGTVLQETQAPYGSNVLYTGESPTYTIEESAYKYYLFDGWDQGGYVNGNKTINAVFDSCEYVNGYFNGKDLSEMRPVEIYMMLQLNKSKVIDMTDYVEPKDTITTSLGSDFSYDDVEEEILVPGEFVFNGTTYKDTNKLLLSEDRDFVLAVDCRVDSSNANGAVLLQCFDESNATGFKLYYNSSNKKVVAVCGTDTKEICSADSREMIVIRHVKGEYGLYIYSSETTSELGPVYVELDGVHSMVSGNENVTLTFGCSKRINGNYINHCIGTMYWNKLWYSDLGNDVCSKLAYWPHEEIVFEACFEEDGRPKDYMLSDLSNYSSITFMASHLLPQPRAINNSTTNVGGWASYKLNEYLNNRLYKAFSDDWRQLMKQVVVASLKGSNTSEVSTSNCYIFIPSVTELGIADSSTMVSYKNEGTIISHFAQELPICDGKQYWTRSPHPSNTSYVISVKPDGTRNNITVPTTPYYVRIMISI